MWTRKSSMSVKATIDRLEVELMKNDLILRFCRIDQAAVMNGDTSTHRPMEMLLFENRKLAAAMVAVTPEAAFELPIRALAWEDEQGAVWLRVTDPDRLDRDANLNGAGGAIAQVHSILGEMLDALLPMPAKAA